MINLWEQCQKDILDNINAKFGNAVPIIKDNIASLTNGRFTATAVVMENRICYLAAGADAIYKITQLEIPESWRYLHSNPGSLASECTTGNGYEWYAEKYITTFCERFADKSEQFIVDHIEGVDTPEEAQSRWRHSKYDFGNLSLLDMGRGPSFASFHNCVFSHRIYKEADRMYREWLKSYGAEFDE
jgi:hypothetical protein